MLTIERSIPMRSNKWRSKTEEDEDEDEEEEEVLGALLADENRFRPTISANEVKRI